MSPTLTAAANYNHTMQFPPPPHRAEVGLLSHNVVVEGSSVVGREGLGADQYGAQIFVHRMGPHPTPIR